MENLKFYIINGLIKSKGIVLLLAVFMYLPSLFAQSSSKIIGLRQNGQTTRTVNVKIVPPGKGTRITVAKLGDVISSGTKIIIPPGVIVVFQSPGGKQVCSATKGKPMEYTVKFTANGENHQVKGKGASVKNTVSKRVGYNYRVNNARGTTAASKGTEFTFTDNSDEVNENAIISTEEGRISIIDERPLQITDQKEHNKRPNKKLTQSHAIFQEAGQEFTSSDEPIPFESYYQAINSLETDLTSIYDPDEKAENLVCLGELYMDDGQIENAIKSYQEALVFYQDYYGNKDFATIEVNLLLAEALLINSPEDANYILEQNENILLDYQYYDEEDLKDAKDMDDVESEMIICEDLEETYQFLEWLYSLKGDDTRSDEFYNKSENACRHN